MVKRKSGSRFHTSRVLLSLPNDPEGISIMQPVHAALRDPVSSLFLILPARHALPLLVKVVISHLRRDGIMLLAVT